MVNFKAIAQDTWTIAKTIGSHTSSAAVPIAALGIGGMMTANAVSRSKRDGVSAGKVAQAGIGAGLMFHGARLGGLGRMLTRSGRLGMSRSLKNTGQAIGMDLASKTAQGQFGDGIRFGFANKHIQGAFGGMRRGLNSIPQGPIDRASRAWDKHSPGLKAKGMRLYGRARRAVEDRIMQPYQSGYHSQMPTPMSPKGMMGRMRQGMAGMRGRMGGAIDGVRGRLANRAASGRVPPTVTAARELASDTDLTSARAAARAKLAARNRPIPKTAILPASIPNIPSLSPMGSASSAGGSMATLSINPMANQLRPMGGLKAPVLPSGGSGMARL
jgi:hypothetical protein